MTQFCANYDAIIEDRKGDTFSIWFAYLKGRLWYVEYIDQNQNNMTRREFEVAL